MLHQTSLSEIALYYIPLTLVCGLSARIGFHVPMVPLEIREPLEGVGSFSTKWDGTHFVRVRGKRLYLLSYHAGVEIFMGPGSF